MRWRALLLSVLPGDANDLSQYLDTFLEPESRAAGRKVEHHRAFSSGWHNPPPLCLMCTGLDFFYKKNTGARAHAHTTAQS